MSYKLSAVNCHTSISIGGTSSDKTEEELLQSAKKRSREDVDDEVGGWRDVDDELDSLRDDLDKSF